MGLKLNGATSGSIEIDVPAVAGTDTAITIPATTGGEFIVSDSSGNIDLGPLDINGGASDDSVNIDGNGRLLVGTTSSANVGSTVGAVQQIRYTTGVGLSVTRDGAASNIVLARTAAAPASIVSNGDLIGDIRWAGADNTDIETQAASIGCYVDGTPGSTDMPGRLVFSTTADSASSPTERVRITNAGWFKAAGNSTIHSATGAYHEFIGDSNGGMMFIRHRNSGSSSNGVHIYFDSNFNNSTQYFLRAETSGGDKFRVRTNGGIANFQSNDANLCDEREKKNIETLDSTWGCLKNWELKKFHYNEDADTDDKRYGVIAQQVAEHCPEVITDWVKQEAKDAELDEDGNVVTPAQEEIVRMGVKEQQMMWMAIKALQEAQTRIETLEAANASQAATIATLDARLTALEGGAE